MTEAIQERQPAERIKEARRSLEILQEIEGKPWTALPMFSPGYRIGRRLADEVVDLSIALRDRKGKIDG